jgi:hypothetical protein
MGRKHRGVQTDVYTNAIQILRDCHYPVVLDYLSLVTSVPFTLLSSRISQTMITEERYEKAKDNKVLLNESAKSK